MIYEISQQYCTPCILLDKECFCETVDCPTCDTSYTNSSSCCSSWLSIVCSTIANASGRKHPAVQISE